MQVAVELEIVGRIGEDDVDGFFRQPVERGDAIALEDGVQPFGLAGDGTKDRRKDAMLTWWYPNTRYCLRPLWLPFRVNI